MTVELFTDPTDSTDPNKNYLEDLVGENKKFKTPEDLAKGKIASDAFILKLQDELAGLRTELKASSKLEQLLERLEKTPNPDGNPPVGQSDENNPSARELDDRAIEQLVEKKLQDYERSTKTQANVSSVKEALLEVIGKDNFAQKLKDRLQALGMSEQLYLDLAAKSPQAAIRLVTPSERSNSSFSIPSSTVTFAPNTSGDRNYAFYQKIRETNKNEYWSPKVQSQMHKDAQRLGEKFYA